MIIVFSSFPAKLGTRQSSMQPSILKMVINHENIHPSASHAGKMLWKHKNHHFNGANYWFMSISHKTVILLKELSFTHKSFHSEISYSHSNSTSPAFNYKGCNLRIMDL